MDISVRAIEVNEVMTGRGTRWVVECYEDGRIVARIAFPTRSRAVSYARDMARWTEDVLYGKAKVLSVRPGHGSSGAA